MNKKVMGVYDGMNLSAEEVSELYGYSIDTVKNHFKRTARAIKNKHGVDLVKCESITGIYYTQIHSLYTHCDKGFYHEWILNFVKIFFLNLLIM